MSVLLVMAVTAAVAASMGYFAAKQKKDLPGPKGKTKDRGKGKSPVPKEEKKPEPSPFEGLPLALGDVVVASGEERWLAGAIVARDDGRVVGVLFLAPEGAAQRAVAAFPKPAAYIDWLAPVETEDHDVRLVREPPTTLEIGGTSLRRTGRLPVTLERQGQGCPHLDAEGIWATFEGGGRDVAVVVSSGSRSYTFSGKRLDEGDFDRLGGGGGADGS